MGTTNANGVISPVPIQIKEELEIIDNEDICMEILAAKAENIPPLVPIRNNNSSTRNKVTVKSSARLRQKMILKTEASSSSYDKSINMIPKLPKSSLRHGRLAKIDWTLTKDPIQFVHLSNDGTIVPNILNSKKAYSILKNPKVVANLLKSKKTTEKSQEKRVQKEASPGDVILTELDKRRQLNEALYQWFLRERYRGTLIKEPMLQQKAIVLKEKIGGSEFTPTNEWLQRWKLRYDVRLCPDTATEGKADFEFIQKLKDLIQVEDFTTDQIFNCGVTGLNYRLLPTKKLDMKLTKECIARYWENTDRLSFMCCSNASGSLKFPLMVIGTSEVPNKNKDTPQDLPVYYQQHPKGWIDSTIFTGWYKSVFIPTVMTHLRKRKIRTKVLLILDIAPFYPPKRILKKDRVTIYFLPSNVKPIIQPNQRFMESIKTRYRFHLFSMICQSLEQSNSRDFIQSLKEVKLVDVFNLLAEAWNDIVNVQDSWNHLLSLSFTANINKLTSDIGYDKLKILNGNSFWMKQLFNICSTIDDLENVCRTDVELWSERDDQTMCSFDDQNIVDYALKSMINNKTVILKNDFEDMLDESLTENFETAPMIVEQEITFKEAKNEQNDCQNIISANQCQQYLTEVINYFKTHSFATPVAEKDIKVLQKLQKKAPEAKLANYCFIDCGSSSVNDR